LPSPSGRADCPRHLDALIALAIWTQIVCAEAPGGFVGSLPSTLSGHVINVRRAQHPTDTRPLFTKVCQTPHLMTLDDL